MQISRRDEDTENAWRGKLYQELCLRIQTKAVIDKVYRNLSQKKLEIYWNTLLYDVIDFGCNKIIISYPGACIRPMAADYSRPKDTSAAALQQCCQLARCPTSVATRH